MKKLALILAVVFTMGLTASTVTAAPKDKKAKTEQKTEEKKDCPKSKECPAATKKACCGDKK
ncbi:MAG: hypothetical protein K0M40_09210 [Prolixibacteraceae bacterium]|nr:hypothetical protein [Prolixibacteraceae bacterium]